MKRYIVGLGIGLVLISGCQSSKGDKLTVGRVDTAALLQDDPDYMSMSVDYLREQTDLRQKFVEKVRAAQNDEAKLKALQTEYTEAQTKFEKRWQDKTDEFLKTRHDSIRETAGDIAKHKNIDMVVIDSKLYPTVEYGGVDMTKDMSLAMSGGSQHKPEPTGTPNGDKG